MIQLLQSMFNNKASSGSLPYPSYPQQNPFGGMNQFPVNQAMRSAMRPMGRGGFPAQGFGQLGRMNPGGIPGNPAGIAGQGGQGGLFGKLLGGLGQGGGGVPGAGAATSAASGAAGTGTGGLMSVMSNVQNGLKMFETAMPMVQQYGPMMKNIPAMFQMMKEFKNLPDADNTEANEGEESTVDVVNKEQDTKAKKGSGNKTKVTPVKEETNAVGTTNKQPLVEKQSKAKLYI